MKTHNKSFNKDGLRPPVKLGVGVLESVGKKIKVESEAKLQTTSNSGARELI